MIKYILIVLIGIFGALGWMYFGLGSPAVYPRDRSGFSTKPHVTWDSDIPIDKIKIFAFYFIPKNKEQFSLSNWREIFEENLQKLVSFHSLQMRGTSEIAFEIYPEPVIGDEASIFYDTDDTSRGNPRALLNIAEELERRVFLDGGDLARQNFVVLRDAEYPVMLIFYEGVGASGGVILDSESESAEEIARDLGLPESVVFKVDVEAVDAFFLLSSVFLSRPEYLFNGTAVLAHEFYHTIGLSDMYGASKVSSLEEVYSEDIMGSGRKRQLEKTHLSKQSLRLFGL